MRSVLRRGSVLVISCGLLGCGGAHHRPPHGYATHGAMSCGSGPRAAWASVDVGDLIGRHVDDARDFFEERHCVLVVQYEDGAWVGANPMNPIAGVNASVDNERINGIQIEPAK